MFPAGLVCRSFSLRFSGNIPLVKSPSLVSAGSEQARLLWSVAPLWKDKEENSSAGKDNQEEVRDPTKDRTKVIPVETSIKYLKSSAYAATYGSDPVWKNFRRNHKGHLPPTKTRRTCIRQGKLATGNPCPICRDEYLVIDAKNTDLLNQFISPHTGETLSYKVTGLCQKKHNNLLVAIKVARDCGLITFDVPFREYDYDLYRPVKL